LGFAGFVALEDSCFVSMGFVSAGLVSAGVVLCGLEAALLGVAGGLVSVLNLTFCAVEAAAATGRGGGEALNGAPSNGESAPEEMRCRSELISFSSRVMRECAEIPMIDPTRINPKPATNNKTKNSINLNLRKNLKAISLPKHRNNLGE
jgi:hypothetical protein